MDKVQNCFSQFLQFLSTRMHIASDAAPLQFLNFFHHTIFQSNFAASRFSTIRHIWNLEDLDFSVVPQEEIFDFAKELFWDCSVHYPTLVADFLTEKILEREARFLGFRFILSDWQVLRPGISELVNQLLEKWRHVYVGALLRVSAKNPGPGIKFWERQSLGLLCEAELGQQ